MTAAKMQNLTVCSEKCGESALAVFVTAGKTVAVTAGEPTASKENGQIKKIGTINIILLVDGNLADSCMVEAIKTLTEAKTVAMRELDIRSQFSGDIATGTLTDSVAVGCTKKGDVIQYAGTFTPLGELIGKCVRNAVKTAMYKQEKLASNRPLTERLAERGITPEIIMSLLSEDKTKIESSKAKQLRIQLERILSDRKIASIVIASLRLDDDLSKGLIPAETIESIDQASFEEIIQTALKGRLFEDKYPAVATENIKTDGETHLGPFTRALLQAVLRKACSNII